MKRKEENNGLVNMETKGRVNIRMKQQKGQGPMKSEKKGKMNERNDTMIQ